MVRSLGHLRRSASLTTSTYRWPIKRLGHHVRNGMTHRIFRVRWIAVGIHTLLVAALAIFIAVLPAGEAIELWMLFDIADYPFWMASIPVEWALPNDMTYYVNNGYLALMFAVLGGAQYYCLGRVAEWLFHCEADHVVVPRDSDSANMPQPQSGSPLGGSGSRDGGQTGIGPIH